MPNSRKSSSVILHINDDNTLKNRSKCTLSVIRAHCFMDKVGCLPIHVSNSKTKWMNTRNSFLENTPNIHQRLLCTIVYKRNPSRYFKRLFTAIIVVASYLEANDDVHNVIHWYTHHIKAIISRKKR